MEPQVIGYLLLLLGAICGGSFGLPSKFVKKDTPWETLWGPFFFFVAILLPTTVFPMIAGGLYEACAMVSTETILWTAGFGFLWGLGSMTLGMSFSFIGLSLAYAINYGAQIITGGLTGFVIKAPGELTTPHGLTIIAGIVVCLGGVIVCGRAAMLKNASQNAGGDGEEIPHGSRLMKGLVVAFLSGVFCGCYGLAYGFGGEIATISETKFANPGWSAALATTAVILWGGSISACGFCVYKFSKNKTWSTLRAPGIGKILFIALVMAVLHDSAIALFGMGAGKIGALGSSLGYAVFMSFAIIVGNANGFFTGEWKGASKKSGAWIVAGILILVLGVSVLVRGNFLKSEFDKSHELSQCNGWRAQIGIKALPTTVTAPAPVLPAPAPAPATPAPGTN